MTNADKIRAMSDEELAKFLCNFRSCDSSEHPCNGCQAEPYCMIGHNGMIDWLQQPAEEDYQQNVCGECDLRAEHEKLRAELEKVKEYARKATVTMNNLYGACGKFCDDTIFAFRQRWR